MALNIKHFFDKNTCTLTYLVFDDSSKDAVIIDPVLDFDLLGLAFSQDEINLYLEFIAQNKLNLHAILETHVHADHFSGAYRLKQKLDSKICIHENINLVRSYFEKIYNLKTHENSTNQFDKLIKDQENLNFGSLAIKALHTPGHTPTCCSYLISNYLFCGDALFQPNLGSGRCDFPNGSAEDSYNSIKNIIYNLPDDTEIFVGHDYPKDLENLSDLVFKTSVRESKEKNIKINQNTNQEEFVTLRQEKDATLNNPKLLYFALQANIYAGKLPEHEGNGTAYLKLPIQI